jgi:probable phosphoglycerate mutase
VHRVVWNEVDGPDYEYPGLPGFEAWPDLQEFRRGEVRVIPDHDLERSFRSAFRGTPAPEAAYLGGETVGSLVERVGAAMDELFADAGWNTLLVVLHGGVNRAILSWALTRGEQLFAQFEQSPGCINIIDGSMRAGARAARRRVAPSRWCERGRS